MLKSVIKNHNYIFESKFYRTNVIGKILPLTFCYCEFNGDKNMNNRKRIARFTESLKVLLNSDFLNEQIKRGYNHTEVTEKACRSTQI